MSPVDSPILEDLSRDGIVSRITEKCIPDSLSRAAPRERIDQLGHTGRTACPIVKKAPFRWDDTLSCTGREASLGALQSYEQKCYLQTRWPRHSSHQLPLSPQHWVLQVLCLTGYCHHNLLLDSLGNMVLWSLHFFSPGCTILFTCCFLEESWDACAATARHEFPTAGAQYLTETTWETGSQFKVQVTTMEESWQ